MLFSSYAKTEGNRSAEDEIETQQEMKKWSLLFFKDIYYIYLQRDKRRNQA